MVNMLKFIDPPCSEKTLQIIYDQIVAPCYKNICTTLVEYMGAGKSLQIRYVLDNLNLFAVGKNKKHVFCRLDLEHLKSDPLLAYSECLLSLKNFVNKHSFEDLTDELQINHAENMQSAHNFMHKVSAILQKEYSITFLIGSAFYLFTPETYSKILSDNLMALRRLNTSKVSFIFISVSEFNSNDIARTGALSTLLVQNFFYNREALYTNESSKCHFEYQEKHAGAKFSKEIKNIINKIAFGDPSLTNLITNRLNANSELEAEVLAANNTNEIYSLIGTDVLNLRFERITNRLKSESIKYLLNPKELSPTDYLINTGLILTNSDKKTFSYINPLFEIYCKNYLKIDQNIPNKSTPELNPIKDLNLTGQEIVVFNLLNSEGEAVSRDELAKAIWGSEWESKYSDWALDQTVSRLRSKLEASSYSKALKTIKGKGFILI